MENETTKIAIINTAEIEVLGQDFIVARVEKLEKIKKDIMKRGIHYDTVPGCGDKPAIKKEGSELLCMAFQLCPKYDITINNLPNFHREYEYEGHIIHIPTGRVVAYGVGSCSTMESKYRWREGHRICPKCNNDSIIKGKEQYGGGWLCFVKKGGCGEKFNTGDASIENQRIGRVENPDIADQYNTVKKIGKKRCQSDMVLTATGASFLFSPDPSEFPSEAENGNNKKPPMSAPQSKSNKAQPAKNGMATKPQLGKLHALIKGIMDDDVPETVKHQYVAALIGKENIESYKDLTVSEASDAISKLMEESKNAKSSGDEEAPF